ncbi:thioesterase [Desulfocarbo indianensis]|nr:thioesterase [Desulfocarbo indianensis]
MKDSLKEGLEFEFSFPIGEERTVPSLLPDSPEFQVMPKVLATGYMVGLLEWACILALKPHLDWPREQTVGVLVNLSHSAATPAGLTMKVAGRLEKIQGRRLFFRLRAHDGVDEISEGRHERYVIDAAAFIAKARDKRANASV